MVDYLLGVLDFKEEVLEDLGQVDLANPREAPLQEEVEGETTEEMLLEVDFQAEYLHQCAISVVDFTLGNVGVQDLVYTTIAINRVIL